MNNITILIATAHTLIREGLRLLCETRGAFEVVGEAQDGIEAVNMAIALKPSVILMDIVMPKLDGIQATQHIMRINPSARIIVLTTYRQKHYMISAVKAGARGYLLKSVDTNQLFTAIRAVAQGRYLIDPIMADKILNEIQLTQPDGQDPTTMQPLTAGEMAVLRLVAQGIENEQIAQLLYLSIYTVGNRLRSIYSKLHVNNRTQAALYALRQGWVNLEDDEGVAYLNENGALTENGATKISNNCSTN
jgi:two-component system, NarL family, response regulator LiaR